MDLLLLIEVEFVDSLEALLQVRLDSSRVLGLGQDRQQLIVAQEVETREQRSL